jgi:hypothetical protein
VDAKVKLRKLKPRGKPFPKGAVAHRNAGGKPFVKLHQKLSVITAEMLSEVADAQLCALVGLAEGATNGECVVRAMVLEAVVEGSVAAAQFLFSCSETSKLRVDDPNIETVITVRFATGEESARTYGTTKDGAKALLELPTDPVEN